MTTGHRPLPGLSLRVRLMTAMLRHIARHLHFECIRQFASSLVEMGWTGEEARQIALAQLGPVPSSSIVDIARRHASEWATEIMNQDQASCYVIQNYGLPTDSEHAVDSETMAAGEDDLPFGDEPKPQQGSEGAQAQAGEGGAS